MELNLKGKVVVVTGGSSGIGEEAALQFAREGCQVAIASRSEEKHETVYELFVPFKAIGLSDRPGSVFQFNLIVNDNDGGGRKGWIELAPGLGTDGAPEKFPQVVFY